MFEASWISTVAEDVPALAMLYLQAFATLIVSCYLLREWSRLAYRMRLKQRERPGILVLNWSLRESAWPEKGGKEKIASVFPACCCEKNEGKESGKKD